MRALLFLGCAVPAILQAQLVETVRPETPQGPTPALCSRSSNLAALERAILETTTSGVIQASSQLMRLCVGEPGEHFRLPVYFFMGAVDPAGTSGDKKALASLLNPLGGNANLAIVNEKEIWHVKTAKKGDPYYSKFSLGYELSVKYLSGNDTSNLNPSRVGALAGYGDIGIRYQTAVVNLDDPSHVGLFWVQAKVGAARGPADALRRLFGESVQSTLPKMSFDGAIDLPGLAVKVSGQKLLKTFRLKDLRDWQVRIGFDFTPKKTQT